MVYGQYIVLHFHCQQAWLTFANNCYLCKGCINYTVFCKNLYVI